MIRFPRGEVVRKGVVDVELKYKDKKIRDLLVFETGVVPVEVDIGRHEVKLVVKASDLRRRKLSKDDITTVMEKVVPRKIVVEEIDDV